MDSVFFFFGLFCCLQYFYRQKLGVPVWFVYYLRSPLLLRYFGNFESFISCFFFFFRFRSFCFQLFESWIIAIQLFSRSARRECYFFLLFLFCVDYFTFFLTTRERKKFIRFFFILLILCTSTDLVVVYRI